MNQNQFGIIFDFNGVIINDYAFQKAAWDEISMQLRHRVCSDLEMTEHVRGAPTIDTLTWMSPKQLTGEQIDQLLTIKYEVYQKQWITNPESLFTSGFTAFCDELKQQAIPMTIATSATRESMTRHFMHLKLDRWFNLDLIICSDGSFPAKPAPNSYFLAVQSLNLDPVNCVVFEDAKSGILSAHSAGIGTIIAVGNKERLAQLTKISGVSLGITDFSEVSVLKLNQLLTHNSSTGSCPSST